MNTFDLSKEQDTCRKEFQDWHGENLEQGNRFPTMYMSLRTQDAWEAWFMGWHTSKRILNSE